MEEKRYDHQSVEATWQRIWADRKLYCTDIHSGKKPYYNLMMFPYPSAEGLHVGNMYAFTGSDIFGRFKRMQSYEVFEPIGLDGFGIHSENYALKIGHHPMDQAQITQKNFYHQLHKIGAMYDWSRTAETYDPSYYRWTQWLFVQMFKHGLAYRGKAEVNWCPSDKTVLADEQVIDGFCERCGNKVEKRLLEQWFFRITEYAEKLLENSLKLDWSEKIRVAQQNWIGKKEGIHITYPIVDGKGNKVSEVTCFTTRPDTNFGATFVVLAPEHPLAQSMTDSSTHLGIVIKKEQRDRISQYVDKTKKQSEQDRAVQGRKKTGVATGLFCVNQLNDEKMPLYISDFVLMGFGTGAVVGVPGHDKRDFEFAIQFDIPVRRVVVGSDGDASPISRVSQVQEEEGTMVNSGFLDGLDIHKATKKMMDYLEKKGWGKRSVTYHLRDWLISRQRYWGPPIPMIYCKKCASEGKSWFSGQGAGSMVNFEMPAEGVRAGARDRAARKIDQATSASDWGVGWYPVPEDQLPVLLPRIEDYKPGDDGVAPLAKHKEFYETSCPGCGGKAVRETDVSDTFLDSSWYFLRYPSISPQGNHESGIMNRGKDANNSLSHNSPFIIHNSGDAPGKQKDVMTLPWDREITKKWLPVHMYTGGAEHSVLHLMYARFVTMALHDWGYIDFDEPFTRFYAHGLVIKDGAKMSKSKGNVVNPDEYIEQYGADALRLYLMFMGPFDQGGDFRDTAMEGVHRWVGRVWRLAMATIDQPKANSSAIVRSALHKAIKKVGDDLEKRRYNTAIAAMMEFTNLVTKKGSGLKKPQDQTPTKSQTPLGTEELKTFILLLAPFAPHLAEELFQRIRAAMTNDQSPMTNKNQKPSFGIGHLALDISFDSVHQQPWPTFEPSAIVDKEVQIAIQVNGKTRDVIGIERAKSKEQSTVENLAKASERIQKFLAGQTIKKVILVPGKLVNFVA